MPRPPEDLLRELHGSLSAPRAAGDVAWLVLELCGARLSPEERELLVEAVVRGDVGPPAGVDAVELVTRTALASRMSLEELSADLATACFVAYYAARVAARPAASGSSEPAFDAAAAMLLRRAVADHLAGWWAISQVVPAPEFLTRLTQIQAGRLLGRWLVELHAVSDVLRRRWQAEDDDPASWNAAARAWNLARSVWVRVLLGLGQRDVLDRMALGKALPLPAAGDEARVFRAVPTPWEVLGGERDCPRGLVERACREAGVDPLATGWLIPAGADVRRAPASDELRRGLALEAPELARLAGRRGWLTGRPASG